MQLKRQILSLLRSDNTIVGKLGDGGNSIFPFVEDGVLKEPLSDTPTPFITVKVGDEVAVDWPIISRISLEVYIYDQPGASYYAIDRLTKEIRECLESEDSQFALDKGEMKIDFRTEWEFTSAEAYDDELQKAMKFTRFGVWV